MKNTPPKNDLGLLLAGRAAAEATRRSLRAALSTDDPVTRLTLRDVLILAETDQYVARTPLKQVLSWLPGYGEVKVERCLKECGISPTRKVGGLLSPHLASQRMRLLAWVHPAPITRTRPHEAWPFRYPKESL